MNSLWKELKMRNFFTFKSKVLAFLMSLVLLFMAGFGYVSSGLIVRAEDGVGNDITGSDAITSFTLGTNYTGSREVTSLAMQVNFSLKDCVPIEDPTEEEAAKYPFGKRGVEAGDYVSYTFPNTVVVEDVASADVYAADGATVIATYTVSNNQIRMIFTDEIYNMAMGVQGGFGLQMDLDPSVLADETEHEVVISPDGFSPAVSFVMPAVPKTIDGVTLSNGGADASNSVTWREQVGTSEESKGASLAGVTITNTIDPTYQNWKSATIVGGNHDGEVLNFTDNGDGTYSYTFPDDTTLVGPVDIDIVTEITSAAYDPTSGTDAVGMSTAISSPEADKIGPNSSNTDSLTVPKASMTKKGEQVDGNAILWNMSLNENKANVYEATITDPLAEGLTVDTAKGITIVNTVTNAKYVLTGNSQIQTDNGATISYTLTESAGKETVKLVFSKFHDPYTISFRTKLAASMADDSSVDNAASLVVRYPDGEGAGPAIDYGESAFNAKYTTAYLKVASTGKDTKTGTLNWKITPSTKSDSYTTAVVTNTIPEDQDYIDGTIGIKVGTGDVIYPTDSEFATYVTSASVTDDVLRVEFSKAALDAAGVDLGDVAIVYDTKARNYYMNDEKHTYKLGTDKGAILTLDDSITVKKNTSTSLQNEMMASSIKATYDDTANEGALHLTIDINGNGMHLTDVVVTDDFSDKVYYKDANNGETLLEPGDFTIRVAEGSVTDHVWTTTIDDLTGKKTLEADIVLTEQGKEKIKLGGAYEGASIYLKNEASMTFDGILSEKFTTEAVGSSAGQMLINEQCVKTGKQNKEKITWSIDINNLGASLGNKATITDVIADSMIIDKNSIVLYEGTHGTTGTSITGKASTPVDSSEYEATVTKSQDGVTTLQVTLPSSNESYRLMYDTYMQNGAVDYSNDAVYKVDDAQMTAHGVVAASAYSWGSGTAMSLLTITQKDALDTTTAVVGTEYGVYSKETYDSVGGDASLLTESNAEDYGWTNAKGKVSFMVSPGVYYIKELSGADDTIYLVETDSSEEVTLKKGYNGINTVANRASSDGNQTSTLTLTNYFMNGVDGQVSAFKLYLKAGEKLYGVTLQRDSEGNYSYVGTTEANGSDQTLIATDASEITMSGNQSSLEISGLPWGTYYFAQMKTAHGYLMSADTELATVQVGGSSNAEVYNNQTILYIKADAADVTAGDDYEITTDVTDDPAFQTISVTGAQLTRGVLLQGMTQDGVTYTVVDELGNQVLTSMKTSVTPEEAADAYEIVNKATPKVTMTTPTAPSTPSTTSTPAATAGTAAQTETKAAVAQAPASNGTSHGQVHGSVHHAGTNVEVGGSNEVKQSGPNSLVSSVWVHKSPRTGERVLSEIIGFISEIFR